MSRKMKIAKWPKFLWRNNSSKWGWNPTVGSKITWYKKSITEIRNLIESVLSKLEKNQVSAPPLREIETQIFHQSLSTNHRPEHSSQNLWGETIFGPKLKRFQEWTARSLLIVRLNNIEITKTHKNGWTKEREFRLEVYNRIFFAQFFIHF